MPSKAEALLHEFRGNATADVTMSLLRSQYAAPYLAFMAAHLGDGQIVDGQSLTEALDAELPGLLLADAENPMSVTVPDAYDVLTNWTKRGWLYRGVDPVSRMERYQLTAGASQAVRHMRGLQRHSSVATESALTLVMSEMRQVATDANPDPDTRRKSLEQQIGALQAQVEALDRGDLPEVNHRDLVDRVVVLAQLVEKIPTDIARYGEQMHANTAALLRQTLSEDPAEFADVLQRMFDGHDVIAESPEGQAFRAFATVIATPSLRSQLESDTAQVIMRVPSLPPHVVDVLRDFIDAMWSRVQEVEGVRAVAFRRMSNFVRGGDALHYRSMRTRVGEAQVAAAEAFERSHGGRDIGFVVPMSGVDAGSVGRLRLHSGTAVLPDPVADSSDEFVIDPAALAGRESIDWAGLRAAVSAALQAHGGYATLAEVLKQVDAPRTGDVMGLWWLATKYGDVDTADQASVWVDTSRGQRRITVPYLVFGEPIADPVEQVAASRRAGRGGAADD
ncbi:DUF3375 domain-containing protein [Catellatospora citrea]|uniref:DUF3375 domain-containing protein n=1 Tax=Catellatospora citrea TaxID=53366 RepID=A0A8J3K526_9ACTN|nr:DUF3375 domain-containing protein [Catellatospora citrea]RKE11113.1 uncharacterized protein DUF3375 [Catellatospora citrea]GIF96572.1 hypothetical protein Cci01nite_16660 [Catellatospora citrea]